MDVGDYLDVKTRAIAHNKSQFDPESMKQLDQYLRLKAAELAQGQPFKYAEAFKVLRGRHLHCFTGAINT